MMTEFILYVKDQEVSKNFYRTLLNKEPSLDVPGMTEFMLSEGCKLGLMPESGIAKILGEKTVHPSKGNGIPRCELYMLVDDLMEYYSRAVNLSAVLISDTRLRDWGDNVCYFADPDGHIIAFATKGSLKS